MLMEERLRHLAELIAREGAVTVSGVAAEYGISEESARRDLTRLEQQGLCRRTHGGALRPEQVNLRPDPRRVLAEMPVYPTYREIARLAAERIRKSDVVYMTGGSFGQLMLPYLPRDFGYTLVVNSVEIACALRRLDNAEIYLAGGRMRPSGSVVDSLATEMVSRMHFDRCFITGGGLTAGFGLTNGTDETAAFQRAVIRGSRTRCLLMPGRKIGSDSFIRVCGAEEFHEVITDWECAPEHVDALREAGLTVTVAPERP